VEGCRQAMEWPPSVQLAVNCSIVQLRRGVAYQAVSDALKESGLAADRLTIEVTERAVSDPLAVAQLKAIIELGVQLAVDDVGTSWNSFDLLKRLAVNTVKIDESFVTGLESREGINRMVVETVVHLAHSSGMATVAEGVETSLHAAIVREFESDAAQGYFFAPPLSGASAAAMAALPELRFPLEGAGWQDDGGWPFPGVEAEQFLDRGSGSPPLVPGPGPGPGRRPPGPAAAPAELDAIDLIDLALEHPHQPPVSAYVPAANGHAGGEPDPEHEPSADVPTPATPEAAAKPATGAKPASGARKPSKKSQPPGPPGGGQAKTRRRPPDKDGDGA